MSKRIITISREFGSGGRTIGKDGRPAAEHPLLRQGAGEAGGAGERLRPKFIEEQGEFAPSRNRFAYAFLGHGRPRAWVGCPPLTSCGPSRYRVIRDLADKAHASLWAGARLHLEGP